MRSLLFFLVLFAGNSFAQEAYDPIKSKDALYEYAKYIHLENRSLGINEIISNKDLDLQTLPSQNHSVGFTTGQVWLKFTLKNVTALEKTYYLETARPITDVVELYEVNASGEISHFVSGDQVPFKKRQTQHRSSMFEINLPQKSTTQFYIKLESDGETINLPLGLYTPQEFLAINSQQQLFLGLFYGILLFAGIIYLFFYSSLSNKTFLYYGLYVFSIGLLQAALDGFIFQYVFPTGGFLNSRAVLLTALCSNFFLLKYCEHYLSLSSKAPLFQKAFKGLYVALVVLLGLTLISATTLALAYPLINLNGLLSLILLAGAIVVILKQNYKIDPYFLTGMAFFVISLTCFVLNNLGILPNNFFTLNSAKIGTGLEVIFLSLSMTNLLRQLRIEKNRSKEKALKKSQEVNELKAYFMSNMSHELRTPLNAIMGIAETELKTEKNSIHNKKQYQIIKNASLSLLSNVNDILDFEKIEKNEIKLIPENFNPHIALEQLAQNWKSEAESKGLHFISSIDNQMPRKVHGDEDRFIQIVNNVLSNAVKFTKTGEIKFNVKCAKQPNQKAQFSIHVSDTGQGMSDEVKENIFDSFNQMRLTSKRKFGGIGLGLTIVKHLIKLFEGEITIESSPKNGTQVFLDIPLTVIAAKDPVAQTAISSTNSLHVLVVEDNKLNQMVMKKLLGGNPEVTFSIANNGLEAIEMLQKEAFDIVLMDLQMPVMDGYEATREIRAGLKIKTAGDIPIIAVTADAQQETRERVLNIGMNDYLTKPVNKSLLFEKIYRCSALQADLKIA